MNDTTQIMGKDQVKSGAPKKRWLPPLTPNASLRWDVVSRLLPEKPGNVFEIGCGRGAAGARIAQRAASYVGCEPDGQSYQVARANLQGIAAVHNCMSFEVPGNDTFDTICAFEVLEHIEDDAGALLEWRSKLRPGGHLVLSVPAWETRMAAADRAVGHLRRYDPDILKARLSEAGFTDIQLELYGAPAGYLLEAFRNYAAENTSKMRGTGQDIAERTASSGRLFQPGRGISGIVARCIAKPMVWLQRLMPNRGPGLVAKARKPV